MTCTSIFSFFYSLTFSLTAFFSVCVFLFSVGQDSHEEEVDFLFFKSWQNKG